MPRTREEAVHLKSRLGLSQCQESCSLHFDDSGMQLPRMPGGDGVAELPDFKVWLEARTRFPVVYAPVTQ
jgi:hypothetical protein